MLRTLPPPQTMYRALVARDSTYEGVFFAGVKTTRIFCRPTCPARKPKQDHVEFFPSREEAVEAGYRPCKRCKPAESILKPPAVIERLRNRIESSPRGKLSGAELQSLGIDPTTARRQFKKYYGMTFAAFARARRMGEALSDVHKGESVIGAQIESGYESASGFFDAFKNIFGASPSEGKDVECLFAKWFETPLGPMIALADDKGLHLLEFTDSKGVQRELKTLKHTRTIVPGKNKYLDIVERELKDYFEGRGTRFSVPVIVEGTAFEKSVWKQLRGIPHAQTRSYSDIAAA
ncbi:MAG TPA: Ada metal-binding domain-containing protein, partial [Bacteroidota bacterium]|nr:Ada metal-binding domain-containing protein [Bacteroidota bacterium]